MTSTATATVIQERRRFPRQPVASRVEVDLLQPPHAIAADAVNLSEGGVCLRLQELLEVRSLVRLQVKPEGASLARSRRPLRCTGRVSWVIQRLDLRDIPPFLYDIGIEFVDPPPLLRQFMAQRVGTLARVRLQAPRVKMLGPSLIRGRSFLPRLERTSNHTPPWHLVVFVDGMPCFSGRYPSERAATAAWATFKRRQARR